MSCVSRVGQHSSCSVTCTWLYRTTPPTEAGRVDERRRYCNYCWERVGGGERTISRFNTRVIDMAVNLPSSFPSSPSSKANLSLVVDSNSIKKAWLPPLKVGQSTRRIVYSPAFIYKTVSVKNIQIQFSPCASYPATSIRNQFSTTIIVIVNWLNYFVGSWLLL